MRWCRAAWQTRKVSKEQRAAETARASWHNGLRLQEARTRTLLSECRPPLRMSVSSCRLKILCTGVESPVSLVYNVQRRRGITTFLLNTAFSTLMNNPDDPQLRRVKNALDHPSIEDQTVVSKETKATRENSERAMIDDSRC